MPRWPDLEARPLGRRFARFLLVGGFCSALGLLLLWLLTGRAGLHYLVSTVIAFILVNPVGYLLNGRVTFDAVAPRWWLQLLKYYGVMALSLFLNLAITAIFVEGFHVHYLVANAVATACAVLLNFLGHSAWTFRKPPPAPASSRP